jgi:sulfotransferase family protein
VFLFIVSAGRSGSSLIHELLARHPDIGFVSSVEHRLPRLPSAGRWNDALYWWVPPAMIHKGRLRYAPSEAWRALAARVPPMLVSTMRDLQASDAMPGYRAVPALLHRPRPRPGEARLHT